MQIDWVTVAAQIVNFLVLVWLLQHFLYGPIIRAMDRREQRIAARLNEASEKKKEAESEARQYRERQEELEERRDRLLADAREKAEAERKSLERSAREEVERQKQGWIKELSDEQRAFLRDLRRQSIEHFYALARRTLGDLANADLQSQMIQVFLDRLQDLEPDLRRKVAKACKDAENVVVVSSRFEIPANDRRRITKAIHERIAGEATVTYTQDDGIACGIELRAGSQTVSWSLDDYFDNLERELAEEIRKVTDRTESRAGP